MKTAATEHVRSQLAAAHKSTNCLKLGGLAVSAIGRLVDRKRWVSKSMMIAYWKLYVPRIECNRQGCINGPLRKSVSGRQRRMEERNMEYNRAVCCPRLLRFKGSSQNGEVLRHWRQVTNSSGVYSPFVLCSRWSRWRQNTWCRRHRRLKMNISLRWWLFRDQNSKQTQRNGPWCVGGRPKSKTLQHTGEFIFGIRRSKWKVGQLSKLFSCRYLIYTTINLLDKTIEVHRCREGHTFGESTKDKWQLHGHTADRWKYFCYFFRIFWLDFRWECNKNKLVCKAKVKIKGRQQEVSVLIAGVYSGTYRVRRVLYYVPALNKLIRQTRTYRM